MSKSTKPKSATSYKDTAKGILPRPEVILLEQEGVKRALEVGFAWIFPTGEENSAPLRITRKSL